MREQRHTDEREFVRGESFRESAKVRLFTDEFGQANPHVGTGSCRPATKGKLAEPVKLEITSDFIVSLNMTTAIAKVFQRLEKKYGRVIALQFIDDELSDIIKAEFGIGMDLRIQQIHEWFGEDKLTQWGDDVRDQIGTPDGQYPPNKK